MKVVIRVLLIAAIILLGFLCWKSIQGPIDFNAEVAKRDKAVIQRLVDIRTAQVAYRAQNGTYTDSFEKLADFIKNGKVASLVRSGDLTEAQLESGMTEASAMKIIRTGNVAEMKKAGLWDEEKNAPQLVRDSIFAPALEVLFPNRKFNADSIGFVPYGDGAVFELATDSVMTASGYPVEVLEAKVHYNVYLKDLDSRLLKQKIQEVLDRPGDRFPGMMVGSLETANNNAGNWE